MLLLAHMSLFLVLVLIGNHASIAIGVLGEFKAGVVIVVAVGVKAGAASIAIGSLVVFNLVSSVVPMVLFFVMLSVSVLRLLFMMPMLVSLWLMLLLLVV